MATKITPLLTRKIGHVPFKSVVGQNTKGRYFATAKLNEQEFVGEGTTARLASLDLKKVVAAAAMDDKIQQPTR